MADLPIHQNAQTHTILQLLLNPQIKIVSYDIFDTALLRPCLRPEDMFRIVGKRCGMSENFAAQRKQAEKKARELLAWNVDDVSLREIYVQLAKQIPLNPKQQCLLEETEIAVESRYLTVNPYIKTVYEEAQRYGKRTIFCSDMYLASNDLEKILGQKGFCNFEKLYVSSEYQASKHSGRLFRQIKSDFKRQGISPNQILHIGDNYQSDFQNAQMAGMKSFHYSAPSSFWHNQDAYHKLLETVNWDSDNTFLLGFGCNMANRILTSPCENPERIVFYICTIAFVKELVSCFQSSDLSIGAMKENCLRLMINAFEAIAASDGMASFETNEIDPEDNWRTCKSFEPNEHNCLVFLRQTIPVTIRDLLCGWMNQFLRTETGWNRELVSFNTAYQELFEPDIAAFTYDLQNLWHLLAQLISYSADNKDSYVPKPIQKKSVLHVNRDWKSSISTWKRSLKRTPIYPFLWKSYHITKDFYERCRKNSPVRLKQAQECIELSFLELTKLSNQLSDKAIILILGHIAAFDKGTCNYLNSLAQKSDPFEWVLLSETPGISREDLQRKILFPFTIIPKTSFEGGYDAHLSVPVSETTRQLLSEHPYLEQNVQNLKGHFVSIDDGYAEFLVGYFYSYCQKAINLLKPSQVIIWNQFTPMHTIMHQVCREYGVPFIFMEFGCLGGTFSFDTTGQMGASAVSYRPTDFINQEIAKDELARAVQVCDFLTETRLNRNPQMQTSPALESLKKRLKPLRPTITYFGQSDYESGLCPYTADSQKFHSPFYKSSSAPLRDLAELACRHNWNLIYKPHPEMVRCGQIGTIPAGVEVILDANIFDLIECSSVVVTIVSQCSYEALLHGTPVVMLGYNQLREKGCTYEVQNKQNLEQTMLCAVNEGFTPLQKDAFYLHIAQMLKYCLYDDEVNRPLRYGKDAGELIRLLLT